MECETLFTLGLYFSAILNIGRYAYGKSISDVSVYMLDGRYLPASDALFSVGASQMSASMLRLGYWHSLNYLMVATPLNTATDVADNALSSPHFFKNRFNHNARLLRLVSALFFMLSTSSSIAADDKLFERSLVLN